MRSATLVGSSSRATGVGRIVLFFAIVAVVFGVSDAVLDAGLRSVETGSYGVFNRVVDGRINAKILVKGS